MATCNVRMDARPEHVEHLNALNAAGTLKMAGPFLDPRASRMAALWLSRRLIEAATAIADCRPLRQGRPVCQRRYQALELGLQQAGGK
jgi:uncharacterized protein YciI